MYQKERKYGKGTTEERTGAALRGGKPPKTGKQRCSFYQVYALFMRILVMKKYASTKSKMHIAGCYPIGAE